jgi:hypothetical protein
MENYSLYYIIKYVVAAETAENVLPSIHTTKENSQFLAVDFYLGNVSQPDVSY